MKRNRRPKVIHSDRCVALHEAMMMTLYCGYGAVATPLFIPSGNMLCDCGNASDTRSPDASFSTVRDATATADCS